METNVLTTKVVLFKEDHQDLAEVFPSGQGNIFGNVYTFFFLFFFNKNFYKKMSLKNPKTLKKCQENL